MNLLWWLERDKNLVAIGKLFNVTICNDNDNGVICYIFKCIQVVI